MRVPILAGLAVCWAVSASVWGQVSDVGDVGEANYSAKIVDPAETRKSEPAATSSGDLIHVITRIFTEETAEGSNHSKLLNQISLVIEEGSWASFETVTELFYPTEYDPPIVPVTLLDDKNGGGFFNRKGTASPKTNSVGALIPAHPRSFEKRDVGLTVKLRPRIGKGGAIEVDYKVERELLSGFANYGALTMNREDRSGNAKPVLLMKNRILAPAFQKQQATFTLLSNGSHSIKGKDRSKNADGTPLEFDPFAANLSEPDLSGLKIQIEAAKIETGLKPAPALPADEKRQIFVTSKFIETSERINMLGLPAKIPLMSDPEFQRFIRAIDQKKGIDILSAPSILMRSGQTGLIEATRKHVYPLSYSPPEINDGNPKKGENSGIDDYFPAYPVTPSTPEKFDARKTGIQLELTARLLEDNSVEIEAAPEFVSFLEDLNFGDPILLPEFGHLGKYRPITITENAMIMPTFSRTALTTRARIPNGYSIVIGGFEREDVQVVKEKIPFLGDLPVVGKLARKDVEIHSMRYFYIVLTAKVVDPAGLQIVRKSPKP